MKSTPFVFVLLLSAASFLSAQCPEFQLVALQSLQRAEAGAKESKILDYGFDLGKTSAGSRLYNKCWLGTSNGKQYYQQIIVCSLAANTIQYMTLDEGHYRNLRASIEDRRSSTFTGGNGQNEYIGKMFRYNFSRQSMDGAEYFVVLISFK